MYVDSTRDTTSIRQTGDCNHSLGTEQAQHRANLIFGDAIAMFDVDFLPAMRLSIRAEHVTIRSTERDWRGSAGDKFIGCRQIMEIASISTKAVMSPYPENAR